MTRIIITTLITAAMMVTALSATAEESRNTAKGMSDLKSYFVEQRNQLLQTMIQQWIDDSVKIADIDKKVTDLMRYEMNLVERPDVSLYTEALKNVDNPQERVHVLISRILSAQGITLNPGKCVENINYDEIQPSQQ